MSLLLLNPNVVAARNDMMTTGIVYMPIGLAYAAAALRGAARDIDVLDTFGEAPRQTRCVGERVFFGLPPEDALERVTQTPDGIFLYAINLLSHESTLELLRECRRRFPSTPLIVLENSQAVTAYALRDVDEELYGAGADALLLSDLEGRVDDVAAAIEAGSFPEALRNIDGIFTPEFCTPVKTYPKDLESLPVPAWELFPLRNYWSLGFAHGPQTEDRYLPLLSSRGCPYGCRFCVVPRTNERTWRPRSAAHVVNEMQLLQERFGVNEFHFEDLNPTISDRRVREMCELILERDLRVTWKLAAGTKVESIRNADTVRLMARAGCRYLSISPESGSARLMRVIDKPFDVDHAARIVGAASQSGIRTQACFILGFPGETDDDRLRTEGLVDRMTREGIDEISVFIVTPVPGSKIHDQFTGYDSLSDLHFSPRWRADYAKLNRFRIRLYRRFLLGKARHHPQRLARQPLLFVQRRFETKMEMTPYRWLRYQTRVARAELRARVVRGGQRAKELLASVT